MDTHRLLRRERNEAEKERREIDNNRMLCMSASTKRVCTALYYLVASQFESNFSLSP